MEAYTGFAGVYDVFMDNVPYRAWADYIAVLLKRYGIDNGLVLDLGCGTGKMTEELAARGYDMIGVDVSGEMLEIAADKKQRSGYDILYLMQDMREFELYGTVRAVVSVCDSINYVTDEKELEQVFRLVNNYLDPGGIFLFDFNTEYKYREILGSRTIAEDREECSFIWENYFDEGTMINEYDLAFFAREEGCDLYRKYQETHFQRAYNLDTIRNLLEKSGMKFIACYDSYADNPPHEQSERILVAALEKGKKRCDCYFR